MLLTLLLGALVGLTLGLTGAGGGIIALPLLMYGAGLTLTEASPIALTAVGLAAFVGTALGLRDGIVRYRAALVVGTVGMCVAPGGVWLAHRLPSQWLSCGLIAALLMSARAMYLRSMEHHGKARAGLIARAPTCYWSPSTGRFVWTWPCARVFIGIGAMAGTFSGLLGVGGGFFIVPSLSRQSNLPTHSVIGTSQAVIALVSVSSVLSSTLHGGVAWSIAAPFTAAAAAMLFVSRFWAARLPASTLQKVFAVLCVCVALWVGMHLLRQGLHGLAAI